MVRTDFLRAKFANFEHLKSCSALLAVGQVVVGRPKT
jgi:hypothetical protein